MQQYYGKKETIHTIWISHLYRRTFYLHAETPMITALLSNTRPWLRHVTDDGARSQNYGDPGPEYPHFHIRQKFNMHQKPRQVMYGGIIFSQAVFIMLDHYAMNITYIIPVTSRIQHLPRTTCVHIIRYSLCMLSDSDILYI